MEYETSLSDLRPISASNKSMDLNSIMDYNEIISGIGGQGPPMDQQRHLEPPPPQYASQPPQIAYSSEDQIRSDLMMQQQQQQQQVKNVETQEKFKDKTSGILSDNDQRDFIYLITSIAILFSEASQKWIMSLIPSLFREGKSTIVGHVFNALVIITGLVLVRKVKISM